MDSRFSPTGVNAVRDFQVWFFPNSNISRVRNGVAVDGINLSNLISAGSHTAIDCNITMDWNNELLGYKQPVPGQVIAIYTQLQANTAVQPSFDQPVHTLVSVAGPYLSGPAPRIFPRPQGIPLWIGLVSTISTYAISFGKRSMSITATTREQWDMWKLMKWLTPQYPMGTNLSVIESDVATQVGLLPEEIILPPTSIVTMHSNTSLANISPWEMIQTLCVPQSLTPLIDNIGRLKGVSRNLQQLLGSPATYTLTPRQLISVNASRQRPPTTRYILNWSDPNLTQILQVARVLGRATITMGFFVPYVYQDVWYSDDHTQRATDVHLIIRQSANAFGIPVCLEQYHVDYPNKGRIQIISLGYAQAIDIIASAIPIIGPIISLVLMMSIGVGVYEVWGTPWDWGHAKNTSEAYDTSAIPWLDNPETVECDFIMNESHAGSVATSELIYLSASASKWSITISEEFRLEIGDTIQFPDGERMYVENFTRNISRGSPNQLNVSGFLITGGGVNSVTNEQTGVTTLPGDPDSQSPEE